MELPVNRIEELYHKTVNLRKEFVAELRSQPLAIDPAAYAFVEGGTDTSLANLFGEHADLIVVHNMGISCKYCTLWADGINGLRTRIESRCALVLMNADPPDVQAAVALERGWTLRMIHDAGGVFTQALGFASLTNGKLELSPGFSTLHKDSNGAITRVGFDFFGPGDMYMPVFPMFELLKDGVGNWVP